MRIRGRARARRERGREAAERMVEAATRLFTRPPWEAYRETERRWPPGRPGLEEDLRVMSLIPFAVKESGQELEPSGSSCLADLAESAGLPMDRMLAALEFMASTRLVWWAPNSHALITAAPVPA